jgi:hypothetical protein
MDSNIPQHKHIDERWNYTRMLQMALNVDYRFHKTNKEVYGRVRLATMKIQKHWMRLAGHIYPTQAGHKLPGCARRRLLIELRDLLSTGIGWGTEATGKSQIAYYPWSLPTGRGRRSWRGPALAFYDNLRTDTGNRLEENWWNRKTYGGWYAVATAHWCYCSDAELADAALNQVK